MGRTWKFTEQIYEELGEAIDKKIETRFDTGVIAGGPMGMFGNPFEKYADEINMGISKMNSYVDMINEADGFNRTKLDRVFNEVAEIDRNYGNQISKCIDNLKHYKNVLYQLEVVMEQALVNSTNGNAVFDFDREKFQEKVADDKHAMDIAYVDRILEKNIEDITAEEYMQIAILLGRQTEKDTTLIQYILNSPYLWEFVDVSVLEGDGVVPEANGRPSSGAMMPNERYTLLLATLKEYAGIYVANKPETGITTGYLSILNNALMYANLLDMADNFWRDNVWDYQIGMEDEMKKKILQNFFTIEYGETSVKATKSQGHIGMLVRIKGLFGDAELEILKPFDGSGAITGLDDLEHTYINHYLQIDLSDKEYLNSALMNQIWSTGRDMAISAGIAEVLKNLKVPDAAITAITTVGGIVIGTAEDVAAHTETKENILKFEEDGDLASTVHTLELYCNINNYKHTINGGREATVVVYPTSVTEKRIEMLNRFIEANRKIEEEKEGKSKDEDNESYLKNVDMKNLPGERFTLDFIENNIDEVDKILDQIELNVRKNSSYNSLLQLLEAEYAE